MTQVKICGVNSEAAFDAVVEAGADYLGFVFFPPSPRFIIPAQAAALSRRYQGGSKRVGLFVEPTDAELAAALAEAKLDILQIYVNATRAAAIKAKFKIPVWRAVGITDTVGLPTTNEALDGFVIEPKPPAAATRPGGNATTMDWSILKSWSAPNFWLLGGGLTSENVTTAIAAAAPPAVDVSSGVETAPGVKSPALIRAFIAAARAA